MDISRYEALELSRDGGILTIAINRPASRNAIDEATHIELTPVFADADADPDIDVVILTGVGEAFSAGGDIGWMRSMHGDAVRCTTTIRRDRCIQSALLDMETPIIAKVRGPAVGLGCSLALYCDFVYATPDARFADPHVSVGLVAGDGGALLWPQLIGYARARRYLLTGDPITGEVAAAIGLITEAVPDDQLDATVAGMAERLAAGPKLAIQWTKASINAGLKVIANAVLDRAAGYEAVSQLSIDHGIAIEAFENKTRPKFVGR